MSLMSKAIHILCPNLRCRAVLAAPTSARGKKIRCRQCGMLVNVPGGTGKPQQQGPVADAKQAPDDAAKA